MWKKRWRPARRYCGRMRRAISRWTTRSAIAPPWKRRWLARTSWSSRPCAASAPSPHSWSRAPRSAATRRPRSNTFGSRFNIYPEQVVVVWAARRLGRPVKWTGDRHEAFLTDYTARDVVTKARLGFDRDGRMLALALELTGNTGAHTVT